MTLCCVRNVPMLFFKPNLRYMSMQYTVLFMAMDTDTDGTYHKHVYKRLHIIQLLYITVHAEVMPDQYQTCL